MADIARVNMPSGPEPPRRESQPVGYRLDLQRVFAHRQFTEIVDRSAQGRGQRATEERNADALHAFVGVQFQRDKLPGTRLIDADDEGIDVRGLQHTGGPVAYFHVTAPGIAP